MSLKARINEDLKMAMKAKDKERLSVLRMILSELKYAAAQVNAHQELPEDEILKVVTSYHKRLSKSLEEYPEGDQKQLIGAEIKIVEEYLPRKMSESEIRQIIDEVIGGAADKNFGNLMKEVMQRAGASADGKMVSQIIKSKLS